MWDTIGNDFMSFVLEFFQTVSFSKNLNMTWVTLIPEFEGAKDMKGFRPTNMASCI